MGSKINNKLHQNHDKKLFSDLSFYYGVTQSPESCRDHGVTLSDSVKLRDNSVTLRV